MNLTEFSARYGLTEHRSYLIGLLKNELEHIVAQGWIYRAFVFGSLVNSDKDEPSDIDVLLCISQPSELPRWHQITGGNDMHITGIRICPAFDPDATETPPLRRCHDVDEMVRQFNESTKKTKEDIEISSDQCVEVEL